MIRLIGATCFALMICAGQTPTGEKLFVLRGQVVDGVSGRPVTGVELALGDTEEKTVAPSIVADAEGRFAFHGLPAGDYILSATRPDFGKIYYDELPEPGFVQVIRIKPDDEEKVVQFRIMPRSTIRGTVRDEFGDPVERALVTLRRAAWTHGRITWQPADQGTTDDRGRYRLSNLPPGGYVVSAALPAERKVAPMAGPVDFGARGQPRFYAAVCDPNIDGRADTPPIRVAPGRQMEIDLTMRSSVLASVGGRLLNQPPDLSVGIQLRRDGTNDVTASLGTVTGLDGSFAIPGVEPGRYRLESNVNWQTPDGESQSLMASFPVEVGSGSVNGLVVPLEPPGLIDVMFHGVGEDKAAPGALEVGLRSTVHAASDEVWAQHSEPGRLHLDAVAAGSYWVLTRSPREVCIASIKMGEQEVLRGSLTVAPGKKVKLDATLTQDCGEVRARVVSGGKPVPDAKVLLLISGSAKAPGDLVTDYADEHGEMVFAGLAPGSYRLWAWRMDESGAFAGPAMLADAEARAVTVVVENRGAVTVDVPLSMQEGESR